MTDNNEEQNRDPRADNARTHGAYSYLSSGHLKGDMQNFDKEKAAEFLALAGGEERFKYEAELCGMAYTVVRLVMNHMEKNHDPDGKELPGGLRILGSYMEILRRNLMEMGLTPASAGKVKPDDPLSVAKVLSDLKGQE